IARFSSRAMLTVTDVTVAEGDKGTTPAVFTARVSRPLSEPVLICAATLPLTAGPSDFKLLADCKTLAPGATEVTFTVSVRGDRRKEADERFLLVAVGTRSEEHTSELQSRENLVC